MKYSYIVHGIGRQGTAAVYDLIKNCEAHTIFAVEPDRAACIKAMNHLRQHFTESEMQRIIPLEEASETIYEATDVALSCASYQANEILTRQAIEYGIPYCDLGGNPDMVRKQREIAQNAVTPVVPECGVSPGLSNILAVTMAHKGATHIRVRCGGVPAQCDNFLNYKLVFSAAGLASEYSGDVPVIRSNALQMIPALSVTEEFRLLNMNNGREEVFEASPTSNNAPEVVQNLLEMGVKEYNYMTLRYPGHWDKITTLRCLAGIKEDRLADLLNSREDLQYNPDKDADRLILVVTGSKHTDCTDPGLTTRWEYIIDIPRNNKFSAMELTTSWGITIVAHELAARQEQVPGFWTPEKHCDHERVVEELDKRLKQFWTE